MNVWIFFVVVSVIPQDSAPYIRTGFTLESNNLILISSDKTLDTHTFLRGKKTVLAFSILIFTTASSFINGTAKISETPYFF